MQKIIAIIGCWCWFWQASAQPNITAAEYFIDTDPGFGNATAITITTPSPNIASQAFSVPLTAVSQGVHALFIRSRDANGKWSVTNRFVFYKPSSAVLGPAPNIVKAEYFFDTDPGFGNATNIPVTPGADVQNVNFAAPLALLSVGIHQLYIRSRDANGKWSVTNRFVFYKPSSGAIGPTPNIVKAEYFFDTDPGFGNATNIPVTPGADVQNVNFAAPLDTLSVGIHQFFIRSQDAVGKWSITNRFVLYKPNPATGLPPTNITEVEYFIDTDPGFGNAVPVAVNPAAIIADFVMPINITGLAAGNHKLFIRSRSATGWSVTNEYEFPITTLVPPPVIAINSITKKVICGATEFNLAYHATGTYNSGNTFNVQLSDAVGSFASPIVIGSLTSTTSGLIKSTIPLAIPTGSGYRVRVVSSNPAVTGLVSDTVFTLYTQPRFADTTVFIVCQGETVNLNNVFNTSGFTTIFNTINPTVAPVGNYQLISSNTALCQDTALITVQQDVATWTGALSSDWHNAGNWSTGRVPTEKTHVIVTGTTPNACVISMANAQAASIQARNGATIQTINSKTVDVKGKCLTLPSN